MNDTTVDVFCSRFAGWQLYHLLVFFYIVMLATQYSASGMQSPSVTEPKRDGGARQGFPEANEMSFGGSLRSVTEGARVTLALY